MLIISAHRLPAPIQEESPTPAPEQEKAKAKPTKTAAMSESGASSKSTQRFNGTWKATFVINMPTAVYSYSSTLIIRDGKTADVTNEATSNLKQGHWDFLPDAHNRLSPLSYKKTNHSDHLVADGSDLMIRWSGPPRLIDWAPKTLTLAEAQKNAGTDKDANNPSALTLNGDELKSGNFVFRRVK